MIRSFKNLRPVVMDLRRIAVFVVLSIGLVGCSKNEGKPESGLLPAKVLRMTIGGSPETIDPHLVSGTPGMNVVSALFENLVAYNYQTLEFVPAVAESWEVSDDGLRYLFLLRKNAKWSNGDSVTAHDFVYSWRRLLSPSLGNEFASDYYTIRNAESYHKGDLSDFSALGVVALNDFELEFRMASKDPLFLNRVANGLTAPVQKSTVEKYGAMDDRANTWTRAGNNVSNGPFQLVEWELNKVLKVSKNPYYWDRDNIFLEGIDFNPAETEATAERLYRAGQVDLVFGRRIPVEKIEKYRSESPDEFFSEVDYATYFYMFNTQKAPFSNINVRRAFAYAVDRELITKRITQNHESPALALSPSSHNYVPPAISKYDPDNARIYLAKAGYPNGAGFPKVTLLYNTNDTHRKIAVAIQQMWKKVLNVDVVLENQEWKVFLNSRKNLDYDIARCSVMGLFVDPVDFLSMFTSSHGFNDTGWGKPSYDQLILESGQQLDRQQRYKKLYAAERLLLDDLPILPVFYYKSTYLKSTKVKGFTFNMLGQANYKGVDIER